MNEAIKTDDTDIMSIYQKTENIVTDIENIIETSQRQACHAVDTILSQRNWLIGYRIAEEEIDGLDRAEYGAQIIQKLSKELTAQYGKGYDRSNLYHYLRFYKEFPHIIDTVCRLSHIRLSWSHYRVLLQVADSTARNWYEKEAYEQTWSVRTLQRNINTQYYYRILQSQNKALVEQEMREKTSSFQEEKLEFIKNPVIAEFLGLSSNIDFTETELESSIISNIQKFLMELGKGFTFVGRQYPLLVNNRHYHCDLVFYHRILKCFVLIDLKINSVQHEDVGQMNMYMGYFAKEENMPDDNPPIGIILTRNKDELLVEYATYGMDSNLFVSKYELYLPNRDELKKLVDGILEE